MAIVFDDIPSMERKHAEKVEKYRHIGDVFPFIIGAFGSWWRENGKIMEALKIRSRNWQATKRRCRINAIQGTTRMAKNQFDNWEMEAASHDLATYDTITNGNSDVIDTVGPLNMGPQALGVNDSNPRQIEALIDAPSRGVSARCCVVVRGTGLNDYVTAHD